MPSSGCIYCAILGCTPMGILFMFAHYVHWKMVAYHNVTPGTLRNFLCQLVAFRFHRGYIYRPQRNCGQGNIFAPVCHSVHREGVCLSACWDTTPPQEQTPPWEQTPPSSRHPRGQTHPPGIRHPQEQTPPEQTPRRSRHPPRSRLQYTVNEHPVRILLECILVCSFK